MLTKNDRRAKGKAIRDIRRLRVENLLRLIEHFGSAAELARKLAVTSAYITQLCGPNPIRDIGEAAARDMERKLDLKSGWLDRQR